jgi:hypothetical protein
MRSIIELLIKFAAVAIAGGLAFSYWQKRDNGRYEYHQQPTTSEQAGSVAIFDTKTGTIYAVVNDQWVEIHPQTGVTIPRKPNRR